MEKWTYPGDESLSIADAEVLGFGTNHDQRRPRWTEITIVGTPSAYFVAGVGHSRLTGETSRWWGKWLDNADVLVSTLLRVYPGGRNYTIECSRNALLEAAELDEDVEAALRAWDARTAA